MINEFKNLMESPQKQGSLELVDNLVKDGMKHTYDRLMYVRDQFKTSPGSFNSMR